MTSHASPPHADENTALLSSNDLEQRLGHDSPAHMNIEASSSNSNPPPQTATTSKGHSAETPMPLGQVLTLCFLGAISAVAFEIIFPFVSAYRISIITVEFNAYHLCIP